MEASEALEFAENLVNQRVVAEGGAFFAIVVYMEDSRRPILVRSHDPIIVPPLDEFYEVRSNGVTYKGKILEKQTIFVDQGTVSNTTTVLRLG